MNKRAKGKYYEAKARKELIEEGWLVEFKPATMFGSQDLYGLFDILAIRGDKTKFIQIKSNASHFYTAKKDIRKWLKETGVMHNCEVWLAIPRKGFRKESVV